jgi:hypothetical protein
MLCIHLRLGFSSVLFPYGFPINNLNTFLFSPISAKWYKKTKTNPVALSPQMNYTDWATSTCRINLVPTIVDRGVSRSQRGRSPTVGNLSFLDRSQYFFFQVAPHLSSQGLSGPRSRPIATQKIW